MADQTKQVLSDERIKAEFDRFFEFANEDRSQVSSVSCRLFARHIATLKAAGEAEPARQIWIVEQPVTGGKSRLHAFHTEAEARERAGYDSVGSTRVYPLPAEPVKEAPAVPAAWHEFVHDVSKQRPEKPDYWSSCGQCDRNIQRADELLESAAPTSPAAPVGQWQPIETAPQREDHSFLVRRDVGRGMTFVMQVSRFEGNLYPDHLESNVDYDDRIIDATHWMPLPAAPQEGSTSHG